MRVYCIYLGEASQRAHTSVLIPHYGGLIPKYVLFIIIRRGDQGVGIGGEACMMSCEGGGGGGGVPIMSCDL